jgi:hypothetical protein
LGVSYTDGMFNRLGTRLLNKLRYGTPLWFNPDDIRRITPQQARKLAAGTVYKDCPAPQYPPLEEDYQTRVARMVNRETDHQT